MTTFPRMIGDVDLYLFNEGTHRRLWDVLGAHTRTLDGVRGTAFAVWAPNAERVSVVGDFCEWNGDRHVMRPIESSGIHEIFVPGVEPGALYKYEIRTREGHLLLKTDPMAQAFELPPGTASRVYRIHVHLGRRRLDERPPARGARPRSDAHLRGASRFVAPHARGRQPLAELP